MTDKAMVPLVRVAEENRIADLAAHLAMVADGRSRDAIAEYLGVASDCHRSDDVRERRNDGAFANQNRSSGSIEDHLRSDFGAFLYEDALVADYGSGAQLGRFKR